MTTGEMNTDRLTAGQTGPEERKAPPAALVIFGASGDLTARKLGPAVENLARHKRIPTEFGVVGVARTKMDPADFRSRMTGEEGSVMPALNEGFRYVAGGYDDPDTFRRLRETLDALDADRGTSGNRLFYLATPPEPGNRRAGRRWVEPSRRSVVLPNRHRKALRA
jgi:glucose-6-phosphate 1-dehydrogenase